MKLRRRALGVVASMLVTTALALVAPAACGPAVGHVLIAWQYDPVKDCLDDAAAIDEVNGPTPGTCPAACITGQTLLLDGPAVFVTTMCPAYPPIFDVTGSSSDCQVAMAAYARGDYCTDAGSTNPRDGGDDASATPELDATASSSSSSSSSSASSSSGSEPPVQDAAIDDAASADAAAL